MSHNRVVFNIEGNDFYLVVVIACRAGVLFVKFVGTREEYGQIDLATAAHKTLKSWTTTEEQKP